MSGISGRGASGPTSAEVPTTATALASGAIATEVNDSLCAKMWLVNRTPATSPTHNWYGGLAERATIEPSLPKYAIRVADLSSTGLKARPVEVSGVNPNCASTKNTSDASLSGSPTGAATTPSMLTGQAVALTRPGPAAAAPLGAAHPPNKATKARVTGTARMPLEATGQGGRRASTAATPSAPANNLREPA